MYFLVSVILRSIFIILGFLMFLHGLSLKVSHDSDIDSFAFILMGLFFFLSGCFFDWYSVASFLAEEV